MTEPSCEHFRAYSVELALGLLDGRARADAIAHVQRCEPCQQELAALGQVVDRLAELAPPTEPPAGFEDRALARLARAGDPRSVRAPLRAQASQRRTARWIAVAAGVAVAGVAGWVVGDHGNHQHAAGLTVSAVLSSRSGSVGQVVVARGPDPWISMTLHAVRSGERVRCELREADGHHLDVGSFALTGSYSYWAAPIPESDQPLTAAVVVDAAGHVLASATFPTGLRA